MNHQFHFKGFEPELALRFRASLVLTRILDAAPYGSTGIGLFEKLDQDQYRCALDIYSRQGPFMANAMGTTAEQALEGMEKAIRKQIESWRSDRGGPLPPAAVAISRPPRATA